MHHWGSIKKSGNVIWGHWGHAIENDGALSHCLRGLLVGTRSGSGAVWSWWKGLTPGSPLWSCSCITPPLSRPSLLRRWVTGLASCSLSRALKQIQKSLPMIMWMLRGFPVLSVQPKTLSCEYDTVSLMYTSIPVMLLDPGPSLASGGQQGSCWEQA